jgi:hypothetical protein
VAAIQLGAVMLTVLIAVIGEKELAATAALASRGTETHRSAKPPPSRQQSKKKPPPGRRPQRKKEEELVEQRSGIKSSTKKTEFQTGGFNPISFRR